MMEDVYYKVTVTKGTMESIVYWWETSYKKFMESIELLYNVAKVDAVELEMITKEVIQEVDLAQKEAEDIDY